MVAERNDWYQLEVRHQEPMSRHTSWRLGGQADVYFRPSTREHLLEFMRELGPAADIVWIGLGSNLLVRDGGIRGVVISVQDALSEIRDLGDGLIEAGAGVPCATLARYCVKLQLGPAEFFAGIPGTVGGALAMNAGAFGGETWAHVAEVDLVTRSGEVLTRTADEFEVGYREVGRRDDEWFLAARFRLQQDPETSMTRVRELIKERKESQPLGLPSCGSVFRNPDGDYAARLIEASGLKGKRIGGAEVSPKHANFIINTGDATAADVEALIKHVQATVQEQHGVVLKKEVHVVGEALSDEEHADG
ncbi:MAG: UDP-N-acetylmuramate dehydrogenase [Gammaproteobacteria bacterium]